MSDKLFDDSSTLYDVDAPSTASHNTDPSDVETEDTTNQLNLPDDENDDTSDIKEHESKSKSRRNKAKKLFKRAKSPISGAFNKTQKEFKKLSQLPKHHYSASPKSPQRSPSRENLTEEYSHLEKKLGEKKSEEWLAFQQMQERIKQTVLKTQTSLNKYTSQSEDEDQKTDKSSNWTGFDEDSTLDPEELVDTSLNPSINISCENNDSDSQRLIDVKRDRSHLDTTPVPSPPISPGPPYNSRISSMENLNLNLREPEKAPEPEKALQPETQDTDLLGLLDNNTAVSATDNISSDMLTQDLLGLESCMVPTHANTAVDNESKNTDNQVLTGYSFTASISEDVNINSTREEPKNTADTNDILMFEKPIEEIKPLEPKVEPITISPSSNAHNEGADDNLFISQSTDSVDAVPIQSLDEGVNKVENSYLPHMQMMGAPLEPVALQPSTVQKEHHINKLETGSKTDPVVSINDDLAGFDPMKTDASPTFAFGVSSSPINIMQNLQTSSPNAQMSGSSPQSQGMMFSTSPMATPNMESDLLSKIKRMSGSQPASPARRTVPKGPADLFGFVKKELKKPGEDIDENDGEYKPLSEVGKPKIKANEYSDNVQETKIEIDGDNVANNPFLSGDVGEQDEWDFPTGGLDANAAAMFGVEPNSVKTIDQNNVNSFEAAFEDNSTEAKKQWTDVNSLGNSDNIFGESNGFDNIDNGRGLGIDGAWDDANVSEVKAVGDVWGSEATEGAAEESNIFQDDFSKLDDIPFKDATGSNVNPFLSETATDSSAVSSSTTANPFLDFGIQSTSDDLLNSKPAVLSDNENFFSESVAVSQKDIAVTNDIFDPFKVTSTTPQSEATSAQDPLDIFSSTAASGDKQLAKPSSDDDHGFMLEIRPASEDTKTDTSLPAPILKPPPKPPKSPQPPRENPFNRESPPEEDFAQFEVPDAAAAAERPRDAPSHSMSTDSYTTEEEEVNLPPLEPFLPKCEKEGFKLMLRYPTKKKIAGNRYWKNVYVKLMKQSDGPVIKVFNGANDALPMQELPLQACYSLSDVALQQYDQYGKIHTVKLQYVFYKERVGIKTERITPSIVKFKKREKPKATMILDHSPQVSELLKFGGLDKAEVLEFIHEVEDAFMNLEAHREKTLTYTKDEITAEVRDEYMAELDEFGKVISQKARVRVFVLAFLTGMPIVEIGMNDKRRRGKEVVGRCEIIPIKTEEWIKLEDVEFHCSVNKEEFENTNNIKFQPLDACQFELLRYRVRLRENKELPLQLTVQQIFKNRKCEIRCDVLVTGYHSYSKKHGQFPCEDIEIRFPIPETWIYMFRYERRFGYGSIHSTTRKPGKIKGLERLTMMAQGNVTQALMEADVGTAKYEHIYRCVVWRIPRLPVRNQGAYTSHLLKVKLDLGPHDEIPDSYDQHAHVEFTMPGSTTSQSQIRSIALNNSNPPEKWVRSMARYEYKIGIEHLDEYPEFLAIGAVYKEATATVKTEEPEEPEERDPRLAVSDTDSSDSD